MTLNNITTAPRLATLAAAAALLSLGNPALAAPVTVGNITLDATYSLGGGPTVDGMTDPDSQTYPLLNGADFYLFKAADGNNVFFHTYGSTGTNAYFGARASGEGQFSAFTRASYSGTFIAAMANPIFNFYVDQGEAGVSGTGLGLADLLLEIRINGTAISRSHVTINQDSSGATCSDNGGGLGALASYMQCGSSDASSVFGGGGSLSEVLSGIGAGESFTLDYDIIATVSGNLVSGEGPGECDPYGGYGDAAAFAFGEGGGDGYGGCPPVVQTGGAIARSGDPFSLSGGPNQQPGFGGEIQLVGAAPPAGVPEPGSLALVGGALAGLAAVARRRRSSPR